MALPFPELNLELFLNAPREDLPSLCSTSKEFREICSESYFWRERFRREQLPLLEEGVNFISWYNIYIASLKAWRRAERVLEKVDAVVDLSRVQEGKILFTPSVPEGVVLFFLALSRLTSGLFLLTKQEDRYLYRLEEEDINRSFSEVEKPSYIEVYEISKEEALLLLYRIIYFNVYNRLVRSTYERRVPKLLL